MTKWINMEFRGPQVTEGDVRHLETQMDLQLPEDYRAFLLEVNGGRPSRDHREIAWRRSSATVSSFYCLNHPDDMFNLLRKMQTYAELQTLPSPDLVIIGHTDMGPLALAIRGDHYGEVWVLDTHDSRPEGSNPRVLWHDRRDMTRVASTFADFIRDLRPLGSFPLA